MHMPQIIADAWLLLATAIWGSTFPIVKETIASIPPFAFLAARFLVASSVLFLFLVVRRFVRPGTSLPLYGGGRYGQGARAVRGAGGNCCWQALAGCVITGVVLLLSYCAQVFGMLTVPAGKAAFIVGMSVVIVPVVSAVMYKTSPDSATGVGVLLAAAGLGFMSLTLPLSVQRGDLLVFLSAIGYAAHILLVGKHSRRVDPIVFAAVQVSTVGVGALVAAMLFERSVSIPQQAWGAILYCGVVGSAFTMIIQSSMQRFTSPTHAAVIYSGEPVFGALFSWLILGETLTLRETMGAGLILAGILVSKISPRKEKRKPEPSGEDQLAALGRNA